MRLWSLHPQYLDAQGLVALWRETLLAQAVLHNETKGYRNHPQLDRFKACPDPQSAMSIYLQSIHQEALRRGYSFNAAKIKPAGQIIRLAVTEGQLQYEWSHLLKKLSQRSPDLYQRWHACTELEVHPMFQRVAGGIESWERP